jgi:hypothetical protein
MADVVRRLEERHEARIAELESMPGRTQKSIWWPFTQHGLVGLDDAFPMNGNVLIVSSRRYVGEQGVRRHGHRFGQGRHVRCVLQVRGIFDGDRE